MKMNCNNDGCSLRVYHPVLEGRYPTLIFLSAQHSFIRCDDFFTEEKTGRLCNLFKIIQSVSLRPGFRTSGLYGFDI